MNKLIELIKLSCNYVFLVLAAILMSLISRAASIGGFRAARLPGQATSAVEPLRVSVSNNHN